MKYIRYTSILLIFLLNCLMVNKIYCHGLPKEVPKEWSISPMLPLLKFQKHNGQNFELLSNGGFSLNYCADPSGDIWFLFHLIGFSFRYMQEINDWYVFAMAGVTVVDKWSKLGFGVGISCDFFGHRKGKDIGLVEEISYKNLSFLILIHMVPSQSSFEASKSYVERARQAESRHDLHKALGLYFKARRLDPKNDEARKGVDRVLFQYHSLPVRRHYNAP